MQPIATCRRDQASGREEYMFKRSGVWWACIRHNGRKIQKSLETSDKKLAKAIEAKIRTAIVEGKYYEKPIGSDKTFAQLMDKFMKEHAPKVSDSMQRSYSSYLKHLRACCIKQ